MIAGRYRERLPRREGVGQSPTLTTPPPTDNHGIGSSSSAGRTRRALAKAKMLNRLATAADQSSFNPSWGQSFTYDGFGNLTNVNVTQGSAPTLTAGYDANNHGGGEDANGNPGTIELPAIGYPASAGYDVENRSVSLNTGFSGGPLYYYSYAPGNKRVWRGSWTYTYSMGAYTYTRGTDVITFWSVNGQKLGDYQITAGVGPVQTGINYYFGAKLIKNNNGWVSSDRLGSVGKFYPYGQERPSATTNGTEKFTGYFRDSETGNDYADQRYMSPGNGRFMTPDRKIRTSRPGEPGTWNRYAYTGGDPINRVDRHGTDYEECDDDGVCWTVFTSELDEWDVLVTEVEDDPGSPCYGGDVEDDACQEVLGFLGLTPEAFVVLVQPPSAPELDVETGGAEHREKGPEMASKRGQETHKVQNQGRGAVRHGPNSNWPLAGNSSINREHCPNRECGIGKSRGVRPNGEAERRFWRTFEPKYEYYLLRPELLLAEFDGALNGHTYSRIFTCERLQRCPRPGESDPSPQSRNGKYHHKACN